MMHALLPSLVLAVISSPPGDWPSWRGPHGDGHADGKAPTHWSARDVRWERPIPGRACSTPVIAGERLFLTTAVRSPKGEGERRWPGGREPYHGGGGALVEHSFEVFCLAIDSGEVLWRRTAAQATPHEGHHGTYGSFASNSPVTDGERVYAFFGSRGVYCYDVDGELEWKKDLEVELEMRAQFGEGTAAALHGDLLLLNLDHEGDSSLIALDRESGRRKWRVDRDERSSWGTPRPVLHKGKTQLVVTGSDRVRAYDPRSGKQLWECAGLGPNPIPTPLQFEDTVLVMSGHPRGPAMMSIRLGEKGDLSGGDAVVWSGRRGAAYTPSAVLVEDRLYTVTDRGRMSCLDAASGEAHYLEQRLPRGLEFKASPVVVEDRIYLLSESGDVVVVEASEELKVLATNSIDADDLFLASPVICDGALYLRSTERALCIGGR
ncbi:MAG: PQQ-binding-like beta-propeller repeat protein [Planctomycetota bacterium]|jgi:outer membrane protein assembly factor BamB|nr:PQQ-binding-like beta-propeller repeat protein [Planctomycetota bacterium]